MADTQNIDLEHLLIKYDKQTKRLDKIIKQSDSQQFQVVKLNEELDIHKNHLEEIVLEKTKELQHLNDNLEQRVKDEVADNRIKDKYIQDQAKFVQLGELVSNIAHQWRQPLNTISTTASGIQAMRVLDMSSKEEEDKALQIIVDTTQNLSTIISNFSNLVNNKKEKGEFVVQNLLNTTIKIISSSLENYGIKIKTQFETNDISLNTVSSDLSQVILNILKNAQEALLKKDTTEYKEIVVEISENNNLVTITIQDNANGISKDILDKIFDPYFTTKHQAQGTGLGLYIAKENMEKYLDGTIEVITNDNGTQFILKLNKKV